MVKRVTIDTKIIYEDLYDTLNLLREDANHASLESGRCITQAKGHPSISKCTKRTSEGSLLLVLWAMTI